MKILINPTRLKTSLKNLLVFDSARRVSVQYFYLTASGGLVTIETVSTDGFYREILPAEIQEPTEKNIKVLNYQKITELLNLLETEEPLSFEDKDGELLISQNTKKTTKTFKLPIDYGEAIIPQIDESNNLKVAKFKGEEIKQIWGILKGLEDKKSVREAVHYIGYVQGTPGLIFGLSDYVLTIIKFPEIQNTASILNEGFKKVALICYPEQEYEIFVNQDNIIFKSLTQTIIVPGKSSLLVDINRFLKLRETANLVLRGISKDRLSDAVNILHNLCGKDTTVEIKGEDKIYIIGNDATEAAAPTVEGKEVIEYTPPANFSVKVNVSFLKHCLNVLSTLNEVAIVGPHLYISGKNEYEVNHLIMGIVS